MCIKGFKIIFALAMILMITSLFSACGEETNPKTYSREDTVIIGTMNLVNGDLIAQYEKWYESELGMKAKVVTYNSGKDIISALASSSVDIAEAGTSPAALAISNNLDIKVIFVGDVIGAAESLVVKSDSGVSTLRELAGKKVATPFTSTAHYSLLNALKLEDMTETDIQMLDMQPDDIFAAWQRGEIDAAYVWYPVLGRLLEDGITITNSEKLSEQGIVTADLVVTRNSFADKHPDVVKKFVELQIKANDIILNDSAKATKEIAAMLEVSEKEAANQITQFKYLNVENQKKMLDDSIAKTLKDTADFLVNQKAIRSAPDLSEFQARVTSEYLK